MNMMIFATGVFIVAVLFLSFMSSSNDTRESVSLLLSKAKIIEEQLSTDSLCSLKVQSIPDTLRKGIGADYLFYEMQFTSQRINDEKTVLELSISERNKDNLIASKSVYTTAQIIFIDPAYIQEGIEPVDAYYHDEENYSITLYPRGAFAPNSYVILKEVSGGNTKLYIIPCTSTTSGSCTEGISKTGCYLMKMKEQEPGAEEFSDNDFVPSCFNVSLELATDEGEVVTEITKRQCKELINENYFTNEYGAS